MESGPYNVIPRMSSIHTFRRLIFTMTPITVRPLVYRSLLATKVTLRFPLENTGDSFLEPYTDPVVTQKNTCEGSPDYYNEEAKVPQTEGHSTATAPANDEEMPMLDTSESARSKGYGVVNILVNCGWFLDLDSDALEFLKAHFADADIIVITDGSFEHLGGLPAIYSWLREQRGEENMPPVILTEGCYKFARASLIDVLENAEFSYTFEAYNANDLDYLYSACVALHYHECYVFTKMLYDKGIQAGFVPVNNGVSIGGAIWKLSVGTRNIVLAPNYRLNPLWYLSGCEKQWLHKADLFVTREQYFYSRDAQLRHINRCDDMRSIVSVTCRTLRAHGSVLIPMDVSSSIIDLLMNLNTVWSNSDLQQYPVVLVSPIAEKLILLYATCLEYMRAGFCASFMKTMWNPLFNMHHIQTVSNLEELTKFTSMPCVFVSTCSSLSFGITSYLFAAFASYERNAIIFTTDSPDVVDLLGRYERRCSRDAAFSHDFTLRLNLEAAAEQMDVDMDHGDPNSTQVKGEEKRNDMMKDQLKPGVSSEYAPKKKRNFVVINGVPNYAPYTNEDDMYNKNRIIGHSLDYGIPFMPMSRADLDQAIHAMPHDTLQEEQQEDQGDNMGGHSNPEHNAFNEYYRKHLDDSGMRGFRFEDDAGANKEETQNTPKNIIKRLHLPIKCGIYTTSYFKHMACHSDAMSLLREICPRGIVVLPCSNDLTRLRSTESHICSAVEACGTYYGYDSLPTSEDNATRLASVTFDRAICIPLDMGQELVSCSPSFLLSLRSLCLNANLCGQYNDTAARGNSIENVMRILGNMDRWKAKHNPQRIYQVRVTVEQNGEHSEAENMNLMKCHAFWSESPGHMPRFSLDSGDIDETQTKDEQQTELKETDMENDVEGQSSLTCAQRHCLDESLFTGSVSYPTLVDFMGECLPGGVSIKAGTLDINGKVTITKSALRYGVKRWKLRGTLDPAFYFSRKMIRKLHNRIEPLYH